METKTKLFDVEKASDGLLTIQMTSGVVDRDKEILEPDGMDATSFMKNPVFLWCHDLYGLPVGKVKSLTRTATGWAATVEFVPVEVNPFAAAVKWLYENEFLNACSVRFNPVETVQGDGNPFWRKFLKWELLELSAVTVPANPEALAIKAKAMGDAKADLAAIVKAISGGEQAPAETKEIKAPAEADKPDVPSEQVTKAGAVLSRRNAQKLKRAATHIAEVLKLAGHSCEYCDDPDMREDDEDDDEDGKLADGDVVDKGAEHEDGKGTPAGDDPAGAKSKTAEPAEGEDDLDPLEVWKILQSEVKTQINRVKGVVT